MSEPGFLQSLDLVLFVWSDSRGLTKKYRSPQHLPEQVFIRALGESLRPGGSHSGKLCVYSRGSMPSANGMYTGAYGG